jgi:hypothetical protein
MMQVIVSLCGAVWIGAGIFLWMVARLATQELLACMLVSFGVAFLGIAVVIETIHRLEPAGAAQQKPVADPRNQ